MLRCLGVLFLLLLVTGCSAPRYVMEQALGQLRVLQGRERLERVLLRPDLSSERRRKLKLVQVVRRYAFEEIGLRRTGAYTRVYDTGGKPLAYNLSACDKTALKPRVWHFPIVGSLPYLGFFDRARGLRMKARLDAQGLDTHYRPVSAFSSLGWFADPVYTSMLEASDGRLADIIIHETTHTTLFLRGEVAFNESLAMFVGNQGALNLMARLHGPRSQQVSDLRQEIQRRRQFGVLLDALYRQLDALYRGPRDRAQKLRLREDLFVRARARYKQIFPDPKRWGSFVKEPLNNAVVLSYGRYTLGIRFHRRVYALLGRNLRRFVAFYRRAARFDDLIATLERHTGLTWRVEQKL